MTLGLVFKSPLGDNLSSLLIYIFTVYNFFKIFELTMDFQKVTYYNNNNNKVPYVGNSKR